MPNRREWPHYRSFLLRFWQERGQGVDSSRMWRFSVEDPHTGEQRAFAGLERLVAFLQAQTEAPDDRVEEDAQERR